MGTNSTARIASAVAILATAYFIVAAIATHFVSLQYNIIRDYISDYAVGPNGWIYGSAFLASCIGSIALASALWAALPPPSRSRTGIVLLAIVGITYAVDLVFPTDILAPGQPPQTTTGLIHLAGAMLGWVLFVVAAFLITHRLKRSDRFGQLHRPLLLLTWLTLVILVALVAVVGARLPVGGLVEKGFILVRNVWVLVLALATLGQPTQLLAPSEGRLG